MEIKKITVNGKEYEFINSSRDNRSGFVHETTLLVNGCQRNTAKCQYYNRTWESYRYRTVMNSCISDLIDKRYEHLKDAFKTKNEYKVLTAKRKEVFESTLLKDDTLYNEYLEVKKAL